MKLLEEVFPAIAITVGIAIVWASTVGSWVIIEALKVMQ